MKNTMFSQEELNKIAQESADKTNKFFEDKIKSLTAVPSEVINSICPREGDKEKLALLLEGLSKATTLEDKRSHIAKILEHAEKYLLILLVKFYKDS